MKRLDLMLWLQPSASMARRPSSSEEPGGGAPEGLGGSPGLAGSQLPRVRVGPSAGLVSQSPGGPAPGHVFPGGAPQTSHRKWGVGGEGSHPICRGGESPRGEAGGPSWGAGRQLETKWSPRWLRSEGDNMPAAGSRGTGRGDGGPGPEVCVSAPPTRTTVGPRNSLVCATRVVTPLSSHRRGRARPWGAAGAPSPFPFLEGPCAGPGGVLAHDMQDTPSGCLRTCPHHHQGP